MKLYHVVAMAKNRVIGKDNKLPWHFSSDLKHFKELTIGSTVIMGRKTFESIGKPLPNRTNFVLSRRVFKKPDGKGHAPWQDFIGTDFFDSLDNALKNVQTPEAYIIGGAQLFEQTFDKINGIYLTQINAEFDGDTFYPEISAAFKEKSRKTLQDNPKIEVVYYEKD